MVSGMKCSRNKITNKDLIDSVKNYLTEVIEKPRPEYEGMAACPFVKKERINDKLMIDVFDSESESFLDKIEKFENSEYTDAVFAQVVDESLSTENSKIYQNFLNKLLKERSSQYKVIIVNPGDKFNVKGFNPRSLAPCFLIVVTDRKKLSRAHKQMMNSKYFTNFGDEYLNYLHVKREQLNLK
tara:strand:- start:3590 stop:4141 length:552 start_codon:yes stop_codon:yes gene_type:complete